MPIIVKKINGDTCVINEMGYSCHEDTLTYMRSLDGRRFRSLATIVSDVQQNYLCPIENEGARYTLVYLYQLGILAGGTMTSDPASKNKCPFQNCNTKPAPIIGLCRYCSKKFCSAHRLPETHSCSHLSACKSNSLNTLSERLLNEKCVADKL